MEFDPTQRSVGGAPVRIDRDGSAFMVAITGDIQALLGWSPDDLIGKPSTDFIYPQDQASAVQAWMAMIDEPGRAHRWRGRYRHRDGRWIWVEAVNTNRLDDSRYGCVMTIMHEVENGDLSVEEQLRAQEQLLTRLAEALPVGIVQFDSDGAVVATNDRLVSILGCESFTTVNDVFAHVVDADRDALDNALAATIHDSADSDGLELRLEHPTPEQTVVCRINIRSLTDADGIVTGGVATVDDITEQARLRDELAHQAAVDELTGALNRRSILGRLESTLRALDTTPGCVSVFFVDLDDFKQINDTLGHAAGDQVLATVVDRLRGAVRSGDHVGRIGGDEFLVVCTGTDGDDGTEVVERRIAAAVAFELDNGDSSVPIRATVGAASTHRYVDAHSLVERADDLMYWTKHADSN